MFMTYIIGVLVYAGEKNIRLCISILQSRIVLPVPQLLSAFGHIVAYVSHHD